MSELCRLFSHTISVASDTSISTTLFTSALDINCLWIYSHGFELVRCSDCEATNNQKIVICELPSQDEELLNALENLIWKSIFESDVLSLSMELF